MEKTFLQLLKIKQQINRETKNKIIIYFNFKINKDLKKT